MIIPNNFKPLPLAEFKVPKDNIYSPIKDYCLGVGSVDLLFGDPCTKQIIWTVQLDSVNQLNLVNANGVKYLLGTFNNVSKLGFVFDKDSNPIVALYTPLSDGNLGIKVLKFTSLASNGSVNFTQLLELPNCRSPALCFSYDWDPGSINNQPCLFYIEKTTVNGVVKHIARMRSYGDKFATKQSDIKDDLLESDFIQRVGMCVNGTIQLEWARVTI